MSHNLIRTEEVDPVLAAIAGHDMEMDISIPDGAQLSETIRDVECDEFAVVTDFPYGVVCRKGKSWA